MDASGMLTKLLSDPAAAKTAADLLAEMMKNTSQPPPGNSPGGSPETAEKNAEVPHSSPSGGEESQRTGAPPKEAPPSSDPFTAMLGNPEFLRKLPEMLSAVGPLLANLGASPAGTFSQPSQASPQLPEFAGHSSPFNRREQDRRKALLLALKPYLSPERAETVDQIIRLTELIELFSLFLRKEDDHVQKDF
ncbi:MAG: hypothetical protein ACI4WZ_05810 [Eubacteriales bacterium]